MKRNDGNSFGCADYLCDFNCNISHQQKEVICMGLGVKIKAALAQKKMTIKELSEQSGVSINTLYSITKRDSVMVSHSIISKLSDVIGENLEYFDLSLVTTDELMEELKRRCRGLTTERADEICDIACKSICKFSNIPSEIRMRNNICSTCPLFRELLFERCN